MFIYLFALLISLVFLGSLVEAFTGKELSKPFLLWMAAILVLFAGLRPANFDRDYSNYVDLFHFVDTPITYFKDYLSLSFYEPMYYLIPAVMKLFFFDNTFIYLSFLAFAFFGIVPKVAAIIKMSDFVWLSLLIYLCNFFLLHDLTQIRAGAVSGLILLVIYFVSKKNYGLAFALCFLGLLFHYSGIVAFSILFMRNKIRTASIYSVLLVITLALIPLNISVDNFLPEDWGIISLKAANYKSRSDSGIEGIDSVNRLGFVFLTNYVFALVSLIFHKKLTVYNKYWPLLIKVQILGLFCFQLFASIPDFAFRISELLWLAQIITIPTLIHLFRVKLFGYAAIYIYCSALLFLNFYYTPLFYIK